MDREKSNSGINFARYPADSVYLWWIGILCFWYWYSILDWYLDICILSLDWYSMVLVFYSILLILYSMSDWLQKEILACCFL